MNKKKIAVFQISIALVFATAILLSSYLLEGTLYAKHTDTVSFLLIAVWFVPFTFLAQKERKTKCRSEI